MTDLRAPGIIDQRSELLRFVSWAATWAGHDELGEGRGVALVDRYLAAANAAEQEKQ